MTSSTLFLIICNVVEYYYCYVGSSMFDLSYENDTHCSTMVSRKSFHRSVIIANEEVDEQSCGLLMEQYSAKMFNPTFYTTIHKHVRLRDLRPEFIH